MTAGTPRAEVGPVVPALDVLDAAAVRVVAGQAADADGVGALNEAGLLALAGPVPGRRHLLAVVEGSVVGYAGLDTGEQPAAAEVVVAPAARRQGIGAALVAAARSAVAPPTKAGATAAAEPGGAAGFWAHGDLPAARALARSAGLVPTRRLARMRRPAGSPLPDAPLPPGVRLAPFRPGVDDDPWLRVNAAAFAGHPEQGRWTTEDLHARTAEDWFDPAGFLLAWSGNRLLGFHWTKLTGRQAAGGGAVGEIYVLGADPGAQRSGLGTALAVAGLHSLADRGAGDVELYVEADSPAVRLYRRLGFVDDALDVVYG